MKSVRSVLVLVAIALFAPSFASAKNVKAAVSYVNCSGFGKAGTTTVVFTGHFGSDAYFNINSINIWGIPFPQQARVDGVRAAGSDLVFKLHTMVTGGTVYLTLRNGTTAGYLGEEPGDSGIPLNCAAKIDGIE